MHAQGFRCGKVRDFALVYLFSEWQMSGLSAPNGTDIDFAKFEDRFSSWICVHSYLTCVRVRKECSVAKTLLYTNVRGSLFPVLRWKCQEGARLYLPLPLSCPVFSSLFSLVSLLSPVYFILYNLVYIGFSILIFLLFFFNFFVFLYDFSHAFCLLYPFHGFFAVYVCFFLFFLYVCFNIGCASMVCVICVFAYCQYNGHSSLFSKKN